MSEDSEDGGKDADRLLKRYFQELSGRKILTREQEIEYAKDIERRYQDVMYSLCRYKNRGKPSLPGISALETVVGSCEDMEGVSLADARQRLSGRKSPEEIRSVSDSIFHDVVMRSYGTIRCAVRMFEGYDFVSDSAKQQVRSQVAGAERVRNRFVESNLRLVVGIAGRYARMGNSLADFVQVGNIGLVSAADRFDYRRGFKFSTYATWWIRHEITRYIQNNLRTIRLPVHAEEYLANYNANYRFILSSTGQRPDPREVLKRMHGREPTDDDLRKIYDILAVSEPLSLDSHAHDADSESDDLHAIIPDANAGRLLERIESQEREEAVISVLEDPGFLKPVQRDILRRRFLGKREQTLNEVGDAYRLTRERIRQIQNQALERIRRRLISLHGTVFAEGV